MLLLDKKELKRWSVFLNDYPEAKDSFEKMLNGLFVTPNMYHEWYNKYKPKYTTNKLRWINKLENDPHLFNYMHERIKHYIYGLKKEYKGTFPKGCRIVYQVVAGSQSFNLATPTSDLDIKGVYVQDNWMHGLIDGYVPHVRVNKDEMYFEIKFFLELLLKGDASALEMIFAPKHCIIVEKPEMTALRTIRDTFVTKKLYYTFVNYAMGQFKKAANYNRKANWEEERVRKKTPAEFTTFMRRTSGKTHKLSEYLKSVDYPEQDITLVKIDGMANTYKVYYYKTKGWYSEKSNELRTGEIPKERIDEWVGIANFNHSEYAKHMKEYNEYQNWLKERNNDRYNTNNIHAQKYDSKNVMHMVRLIMTTCDIPVSKTINIDRSNEREYLLSIKRGEVNLEEVLNEWLTKGIKQQTVFAESDLREEPDINLVKDYLKSVRLGYVSKK